MKISDEPLLKDLFYSLSEDSMYRRFISMRRDMPHERLQPFVVIDYTKEMEILAVIPKGEKEELVGIGQYSIQESNHTAEVAFAVKDEWHDRGIGGSPAFLSDLPRKEKGTSGVYGRCPGRKQAHASPLREDGV